MKQYECLTCGRKHSIYYGIDVPEPISVLEIPQEERASRIQDVNNEFFVDKKYLIIKGQLIIQTQEWTSEDFNFSIWIKIKASNFRTAMPTLKQGKIAEIEGVLDCEIPFYENIRNLKAKCFIDPNQDDARIVVQEESDIYDDQQNPIPIQRAMSLMNKIHHSKQSELNEGLEKTFRQGFDETLNKAIDKLGTSESNFAINILASNSTLFQIINSKMLDLDAEALTIYLPFDVTGIEEKERLEIFSETIFYPEFTFIDLDGIPTYYKVYLDIESLIEMAKKLIVNVYQSKIESVRFEIFDT